MQLLPAIVQAASKCEAHIVRCARIYSTDVALLEVDPFAIRIDLQPHSHSVERYTLIVRRRSGSKNNRLNDGITARKIDQPYPRLLLWRVQGRAHSKLIAARLNLKRNR